MSQSTFARLDIFLNGVRQRHAVASESEPILTSIEDGKVLLFDRFAALGKAKTAADQSIALCNLAATAARVATQVSMPERIAAMNGPLKPLRKRTVKGGL